MIKPIPLLADGLLQEYFLQAIFRSLINDQTAVLFFSFSGLSLEPHQ